MLGHFVPRKRFNPYRMCLWRRFVREKRFRWYGKQFLRERFSRGWGGCIKTPLCPLMRPAGVEPLEVRFAHPVRLAPATHSQGHGRPCLPRLHPRRAFPKILFLLFRYIYICSLKQQYREICVKMQQSLCELHLCKDG